MLVLAANSRLDVGSVGLAIARRWAGAGAPVLFVDADATGARLAQRFGEAVYADYSPADRGLPSLMVARRPLTLPLLADHCYSLDSTGRDRTWALFAPSHPEGGRLAAGWLAERAGDLAAIDRERAVLLTTSLAGSAELLASLPWDTSVLAVLAAVPYADAARHLAALCGDVNSSRCPHRALIVEGDSALSDEVLSLETGMHVAGRLPVVDDETVLRLRGGRRERAFLDSLDRIAGRLLSYAKQVATAEQPSHGQTINGDPAVPATATPVDQVYGVLAASPGHEQDVGNGIA